MPISSRVWLRAAACALAGLGGPAAGMSAQCARPALEEALRARHPALSVSLEVLDEAESGTPAAVCTVRRVEGALRRRMAVDVELADAAGRTSLRRVVFEVTGRLAAWRLAADATPEAPLRADQVEATEVDGVAQPDAATAPVTGWRLRQGFAAGHIVRRGDVVPADSVLRGDAVNVVYRAGALLLQVPGQALSQAAPGQAVRVAVDGRQQALVGRLGEEKKVEVQP